MRRLFGTGAHWRLAASDLGSEVLSSIFIKESEE
jgi:hypothetical protein